MSKKHEPINKLIRQLAKLVEKPNPQIDLTTDQVESLLKHKGIEQKQFRDHFNVSKQSWFNWKQRGIPGKKRLPIVQFIVSQ